MKALSVIIPIYNSEQYVNHLISQLKQQTVPAEEVIFVNDGSTDCTMNTLINKSSQLEHCKIMCIKNGGGGQSS